MLSFFINLWSTLWTTLTLAAVGALIGGLAYGAGRFFGVLSGLLISAAVGAVLVVGAYGSGALSQLSSDNAKQQIADLQAQNEKLNHDLAALQEIRDFESKQADEQAKKTEAIEKQYQSVLSLIEQHKDDASCISPEELEAIGKIQ